MNKTKLISIIGILTIISLYSLSMALAVEDSIVFPEDSLRDQRVFKIKDLKELTEYGENITDLAEEDDLKELDQYYNILEENWDNTEYSKTLTDSEYNEYKALDFRRIEITDLDKDNASIDFYTEGDTRDIDIFLVLFWSNCSKEGFTGLGASETYTGAIETIYAITMDNRTVFGNIDLNHNGFSIIIPSNWFRDKEDCCFKAISYIPDTTNTEDIKFLFTDLYSSYNSNPILQWLIDNWLLILIISTISLFSLVFIYYFRKKRKPKKSSKKKKTKRRSRIR